MKKLDKLFAVLITKLFILSALKHWYLQLFLGTYFNIVALVLSLLEYNLCEDLSCLQSIAPHDAEHLSSRAELIEAFCIFHEFSAFKATHQLFKPSWASRVQYLTSLSQAPSWEYLLWWNKYLVINYSLWSEIVIISVNK